MPRTVLIGVVFLARRTMEERRTTLSITNDIPRSALLDFTVCIVSASLALFWVVLRIVSRFRSKTRLRFNDYAIIWAMFWGICLAVNSILTVTYGGIGHHMSEIVALAPQNIEPMLKVRPDPTHEICWR